MDFRVNLEEGKKIANLKIVWALIIVFLSLNTFLIIGCRYYSQEMKAVGKIAENIGINIDEKFISKIESEQNKNLIEINQIMDKYYNKQFDSVSEIFENGSLKNIIYGGKELSKIEEDKIIYAMQLENYKNLSVSLENDYRNINIKILGESYIEAFDLSGQTEKIVKENYKKLDDRFNEIKLSNEYKQLFFYEGDVRAHSFLFENIISKAIFEIVILIVLITSFLVNYERDNNTSLLVATTKRGRKTEKNKFLVSIFAAIFSTISILLPTLIIYFCAFDYSKFWNISINSMFSWGKGLPNISWFDLSFRGYLILCVAVIFVIAVITAMIAFAISLISKSSYKSIFIFFIIFAVIYMLPKFVGTSSTFIIWSHWNVFSMIASSGAWFLYNNPFTSFGNYEAISLSLSFIVSLIICGFSYRKYKKEDLI